MAGRPGATKPGRGREADGSPFPNMVLTQLQETGSTPVAQRPLPPPAGVCSLGERALAARVSLATQRDGVTDGTPGEKTRRREHNQRGFVRK